jgi:ribosomal-protein-alanine acetyltransferase
MTAAFRIRRGMPTDLPALLALERGSFTTDHLSPRQYRQHLNSPTALVLVAADGAGLLGTAIVFFRRETDLARLYSIAVADGARGRGIGEALLTAVERAARRRGAARMRLEVRQDNAAAMRLYERRGYARFAERAGYYEDGGDAWRYEKKLGTRDEGRGARGER